MLAGAHSHTYEKGKTICRGNAETGNTLCSKGFTNYVCVFVGLWKMWGEGFVRRARLDLIFISVFSAPNRVIFRWGWGREK